MPQKLTSWSLFVADKQSLIGDGGARIVAAAGDDHFTGSGIRWILNC